MTTPPPMRSAHPYFMHEAIHGQPDAISRMLAEEHDSINALAEVASNADRIHIVGIGTSWHASLVGEYLLTSVGGREDARAWNSFEFCSRPPTLGETDLVIVMSHRGTKMYSAQALELAKQSGAATAIVTGIGSAANTDLADAVVRTTISDPSSAFTISHIGAMTALAMLAAQLGDSPEGTILNNELSRLPDLVSEALRSEDAVKEWAAETSGVQRHYFTGWGPNSATAYEVSLKMKEANYTTTEGLHLEQYLHGPFVSTDEGCQVTFVAPPATGKDRVVDLMGATRAVGARTAAIVQAGDETRSLLVDTAVSVPAV
ncbi:MAG: SIS domain-containing protein, partial [SAR202 cluster bacterium]|nr:SIS domain-containing protein [SAR202 cluster bacterium]